MIPQSLPTTAMRTSLAAFALLAAAATASAADTALGINVMAKLPHVEFVYGEAIPLTVTLQNPGAKALIIDDYPPYDQNTFALALRTEHGRAILPTAGSAPAVACTVKPGDSTTFTVDVAQIYGSLPEGHYQLGATLNRGSETFASQVLTFSVVSGIEIGTATRPSPGRDNAALACTLLYWAREQREYLFLRIVEKPSDTVYGFANLGSIVRIATPRIDFEDGGIAVVTYQTSRDRFTRASFDLSGPQLRLVGTQPMVSAASVEEAKATQRAMESVERHIEAKQEAEGSGFFKRRTTRVRKLPEGTQQPKK